MDKTDRLRDYGLAFLLYEHGLGVCGYELIRELFIFVKLILNSYLYNINAQVYTIYIPKYIDITLSGILFGLVWTLKLCCMLALNQLKR